MMTLRNLTSEKIGLKDTLLVVPPFAEPNVLVLKDLEFKCEGTIRFW
jgi:hypothetical protein